MTRSEVIKAFEDIVLKLKSIPKNARVVINFNDIKNFDKININLENEHFERVENSKDARNVYINLLKIDDSQ